MAKDMIKKATTPRIDGGSYGRPVCYPHSHKCIPYRRCSYWVCPVFQFNRIGSSELFRTEA